jgi:hypothetical protein
MALSGPGLQPSPTFSPSSLTFGPQVIGTTSAAQTRTLSSPASAPLGIISIFVAGASPWEFQQTNNCGSSLLAGGSCTVNATFSPNAAGTQTASIYLYYSASGTLTGSLSGTGLLPPTPRGTYSLTVFSTSWNNGYSDTHTQPITVNVQ